MTERTLKVEARLYGGLERVFQENQKQVELTKASTVRALLELVCNSPERRREIFDDHGQIRPDLVVLRNGRSIVFLGGLDTELNDGDAVAVFLPVRGG
jgi:molybdopterin synthase sulfur carrier subunit